MFGCAGAERSAVIRVETGTKENELTAERKLAVVDGTIEKPIPSPVTFEINYGAIARGYRKTPYPDPRITDTLTKRGAKIIKTSDCHDKRFLLYGL